MIEALMNRRAVAVALLVVGVGACGRSGPLGAPPADASGSPGADGAGEAPGSDATAPPDAAAEAATTTAPPDIALCGAPGCTRYDDGTCMCEAPLPGCQYRTVNFLTDPDNCGACAHACAP